MAVPASPDPRRVAGEIDIRPLVARAPAGMPVWVIAVGIALLAVLLFGLLDARRRAASAPPVKLRYDDGTGAVRTPRPLFIPAAPPPVALPLVVPPVVRDPAPVRVAPTRVVYVAQPVAAVPVEPSFGPPRTMTSGAMMVLDIGGAGGSGAASNGDIGPPGGASAEGTGATRATVLRHRPTVVVQGMLIPAVLESALDSARPGLTRALVSRDVRGFDGTRVLIPRGSRLFGDYRADLQPGQNRALITWTRLIRPDGVTIAIGSPVSDPLGRAGVRGTVDSHFLARFGAALLQSTLDIGVNLTSRIGSGTSSVVVALPGAGAAVAQPLTQGIQQIQPTLRLRQGISISVFVAHDLDFTAVERAQ